MAAFTRDHFDQLKEVVAANFEPLQTAREAEVERIDALRSLMRFLAQKPPKKVKKLAALVEPYNRLKARFAGQPFPAEADHDLFRTWDKVLNDRNIKKSRFDKIDDAIEMHLISKTTARGVQIEAEVQRFNSLVELLGQLYQSSKHKDDLIDLPAQPRSDQAYDRWASLYADISVYDRKQFIDPAIVAVRKATTFYPAPEAITPVPSSITVGDLHFVFEEQIGGITCRIELNGSDVDLDLPGDQAGYHEQNLQLAANLHRGAGRFQDQFWAVDGLLRKPQGCLFTQLTGEHIALLGSLGIDPQYVTEHQAMVSNRAALEAMQALISETQKQLQMILDQAKRQVPVIPSRVSTWSSASLAASSADEELPAQSSPVGSAVLVAPTPTPAPVVEDDMQVEEYSPPAAPSSMPVATPTPSPVALVPQVEGKEDNDDLPVFGASQPVERHPSVIQVVQAIPDKERLEAFLDNQCGLKADDYSETTFVPAFSTVQVLNKDTVVHAILNHAANYNNDFRARMISNAILRCTNNSFVHALHNAAKERFGNDSKTIHGQTKAVKLINRVAKIQLAKNQIQHGATVTDAQRRDIVNQHHEHYLFYTCRKTSAQKCLNALDKGDQKTACQFFNKMKADKWRIDKTIAMPKWDEISSTA